MLTPQSNTTPDQLMQSPYILEMNHCSKRFPGVQALDDVSIKIRPGSIHSLMGENGAGKSTLMKCLFGIYALDEGEIILNGQPVRFARPSEALKHRVSMVHQELNQVLGQTVMENVWLGRYPLKNGLVDSAKMLADTKRIFEDLNINVNPKALVGTLSVSQKQMVEIAKAVSYDAQILVLDEPTSSLTETEVEHLFRIIDKLKRKKTSFIYISHKMDEILRISDEVTVMRDGRWVATEPAASLTFDKIINLMVGRTLTDRFPPKKTRPGENLMEIKNLVPLDRSFKSISFDLRRGEILGVAGLVGSKRTELLETIFGINAIAEGSIWLNGKQINNTSPSKSMKNGFAMLTEERRATGIFGDLNIAFNMTISNLDRYIKRILLSDRLIQNDTQSMINTVKIKTSSIKTRISDLSGGNQQKVILSRWLLTEPTVFLLDEPTRGIDVGAKYEIYQIMNDLAALGKSIIVVSSEMAELMGICDRILVMSNGHLSGIFDTKNLTQVQIMEAQAKYI